MQYLIFFVFFDDEGGKSTNVASLKQKKIEFPSPVARTISKTTLWLLPFAQMRAWLLCVCTAPCKRSFSNPVVIADADFFQTVLFGECRTTFFRDKGNKLLSRTFFTILFFVRRKNRAIKTSQSRSTFSVPPPLSPPITRSRKKSGVYFLKPSAHTKMRESRCCRSSH